MKTEQIISNYFKSIAESHVDILHVDGEAERFLNWEIGEKLGNTNLDLNNFCLIVHNLGGEINGSNTDSLYKYWDGGFRIIKVPADEGDYALRMQTRDACGEIAEQIIAKIIQDYSEQEEIATGVRFQDVDTEINTLPIMSGIDGEVGWLVELKIRLNFNLQYDPDKWQ